MTDNKADNRIQFEDFYEEIQQPELINDYQPDAADIPPSLNTVQGLSQEDIQQLIADQRDGFSETADGSQLD